MPNDGQVVSNFIVQALQREPLSLYREGSQSRSFCYIDDLVCALTRLMNGSNSGTINIGSPDEFTIREVAEIIRKRINRELSSVKRPLRSDDPHKHQSIINLAKKELNCQPTISIEQGIENTISWFQSLQH